MDKQIKERKQEWENVCIESGKPHWKLKILVKTKYSNKVIMFEEMLEFKQVFLLWEAKYINFAVISLEGPNMGQC